MSINEWIHYFWVNYSFKQFAQFALFNLTDETTEISCVLSPPNCSGWQVIFVAIFFAMILRPVAVENNEEVELLLQGENMHTKNKTKELRLCQYQTVFSLMLFCHFTGQKGKCEEYAGRSISWLHLTSDSNCKGGCLIWDVIELTQFYSRFWCWEQRMPFSCLCKWLASHCLLQIIIQLCRQTLFFMFIF